MLAKTSAMTIVTSGTTIASKALFIIACRNVGSPNSLTKLSTPTKLMFGEKPVQFVIE